MRPEKGAAFCGTHQPQWQTGILGKRPGRTGQNHQKGDPVTLTLQARETFRLSGETRDRIRNIWAITPVSNGITVNNDQPHAGQHTLEFPMATFSQVMLQMQQHWPQIMQEVRSPKILPIICTLVKTGNLHQHLRINQCDSPSLVMPPMN